ncbi:MAG: queuosine precursor transporter [Bacteroidales bacterium]|nr:queuosine precursor transporter [Candidatus Scybalousia scybalohippi]
MKKIFKQQKNISVTQTLLTILFTVALVISNIISGRTFNFFGNTMTSAVIVFPITYILSDVFSQAYGYKWSRLTCYIAFTCNLLAVGVFAIVNSLPTLEWMQETANAFNTLLGGISASTFASLIAYVVGDFMNDKVFVAMQKGSKATNMKGFGLRAILSSLVGELADSFIYLPLAFCVFNPIMSVSEVLKMIAIQVSLKVAYEIMILPLTTIVTKKVLSIEYKQGE